MVSKTNYLLITLVMIAVLLLFQFFGIARLLFSGDEINDYTQKMDSVADLIDGNSENETGYSGSVALVTEASGQIVSEWADNYKWAMNQFDSLEKCYKSLFLDFNVVLIDPAVLNLPDDIDALHSIIEYGASIIFTDIPAVWQLNEYPELASFMGIREVSSDIDLSGIKLYDGFLLGGEVEYDEITPTIPWVKLNSGVKIYATGLLDGQDNLDITNEDLPKLVWRYSNNQAKVFVVHHTLFDGYLSHGVLSALISEINGTFLYPVVNAQVMVLDGYPYLGNENGEEISKLYSMSTEQLCMNIIWPSLVSTSLKTGYPLSCLAATQFNSSDRFTVNEDSIAFYNRQIEQQSFEMGISGLPLDNGRNSEEYASELNLVRESLPRFNCSAFSTSLENRNYASLYKKNNPLNTVRTNVIPLPTDESRPIFSWYKNREDVLQLSVTGDASDTSQTLDLLTRSFETAYGYSCLDLDFSNVIFPQKATDDWASLAKIWSSHVSTDLDGFKKFDRLTLSDADARVRTFLSLDYSTKRENDTITLQVDDDSDSAWFMLVLNGENITRIEGGNYVLLEKGHYLIQADNNRMTIKVSGTDESTYIS